MAAPSNADPLALSAAGDPPPPQYPSYVEVMLEHLTAEQMAKELELFAYHRDVEPMTEPFAAAHEAYLRLRAEHIKKMEEYDEMMRPVREARAEEARRVAEEENRRKLELEKAERSERALAYRAAAKERRGGLTKAEYKLRKTQRCGSV
jgi:hypothetical protein